MIKSFIKSQSLDVQEEKLKILLNSVDQKKTYLKQKEIFEHKISKF